MLAIVLGSLLVGCGDVTGAGSGGVSVVTPPPSEATAIPPQVREHMDRLSRIGGYTRRVDRITARLVPWAEYLGSGVQVTTVDPQAKVWVIAAIGEFVPDAIIDLGTSSCARWAIDPVDYHVRSGATGPLARCAPYFSDSLVPPAERVRCPPEPSDYGYRHGQPTPPGPVALRIQRDDAWRMPTTVPAGFLYEYGAKGFAFYGTFCRVVNIPIVRGPLENAMLAALGSPKVSTSSVGGEIWLKGYHAISAAAAADHVNVLVETRPGFEIASFDWSALAPDGGYVRFEFRDRAGVEITFEVANGP